MTHLTLTMNYLMLSHSLRLPLAQILGLAETLEMSHLTNIQRKDVHAIRKAGVELLQTVDQILSGCSKEDINLGRNEVY